MKHCQQIMTQYINHTFLILLDIEENVKHAIFHFENIFLKIRPSYQLA